MMALLTWVLVWNGTACSEFNLCSNVIMRFSSLVPTVPQRAKAVPRISASSDVCSCHFNGERVRVTLLPCVDMLLLEVGPHQCE